jgi:hypothetical protein
LETVKSGRNDDENQGAQKKLGENSPKYMNMISVRKFDEN